MKKFQVLISLFIFISLISVIPKSISSDCLHSYAVGYWFAPCHMYDWLCEYCGDCRMSCVYEAVYITCTGDDGNEYWLSRVRNEFCWGIPIIV